jgi:hypothetical protein
LSLKCLEPPALVRVGGVVKRMAILLHMGAEVSLEGLG